MKNKKKNRFRSKKAYIIIGLFLCVSVIASMGYDRYERGKGTRFLIELSQKYGPGKAADKQENDGVKKEVNIQTGLYNSPVDFAALQEMNGDVQAWITQNQVGVDYPVVQTDNNKYYLNHAFNGEKSDYGTIMINSDNYFPFQEDQNTILFGHSMKDGEMFGNLHMLESTKEIGDIVIYRPAETLYYHIFCVAIVPPDAPVYRIAFTEQEMKDCMEYLKNTADWWEEPVGLPGERHLLTLSTCAENQRLIVWAYKEE